MLVIISIDGWQISALDSGGTPFLAQLRAEGAGGTAKSVFPSMTWPAHAAMLTGKGPRGNCVVGNVHFDRIKRRQERAWELPEEEALCAPTFYGALRREGGLSSAALLWPLTSASADLSINVPEIYGGDLFASTIDDNTRQLMRAVGQSPSRWAQASYGEDIDLDRLTCAAALHLIETDPPDVLLLHFVSYDTRQHRSGPNSAHARAALAFIDSAIGDLLLALERRELRDRSAILIVSDHGFLPVRYAIDLNRQLQRGRLVQNPGAKQWEQESVWTVGNGHMAHAYALADDKKPALRAALQRTPGLFRLFQPADYKDLGLPTPEENPRAGDFVAVLNTDRYFTQLNGRATAIRLANPAGMHGYFPDHPAMLAGWILSGGGAPAIAEHQRIELRDVAPAALAYFGIEDEAFAPGSLDPLMQATRGRR